MRSSTSFCRFAIVLGVLSLASTAAYANSVTYDVTGLFSDGTSLTGWVDWSSSLGTTAYNLGLSNTSDLAQCASLTANGCALVFNTFSSGLNTELLAGLLSPVTPLFALVGPGFQLSLASVSWNAVVVPEEPAVFQLLLVLTMLTIVMFSAPRIRQRLLA
jgi:hypothetical protein